MGEQLNYPYSFSAVAPDITRQNRPRRYDFVRLIDEDTIRERTTLLARAIISDFTRIPLETPPLFVFVPHGGTKFGHLLTDTVTALAPELEPEIDTMQYSSDNRGQGGLIRLHKQPSVSPTGRHTIIVEDIVDSGNTVRSAFNYLHTANPASLAVACLVQREAGVSNLSRKPRTIQRTNTFRHEHQPKATAITVNYPCFDITGGFAVGFGMDLPPNGRFRSWPGVYVPDHPSLPHKFSEPDIPGITR